MYSKILIYRRGSIGDAIVSIPAINEIRRQFPHAEIRLLSNTPVSERAATASSILEETELVDGSFHLPPGGGGVSTLSQVRAQIKAWAPDALIYLSEPSKLYRLMAEVAYFRWCGVSPLLHVPWGAEYRTYKKREDELYESESSRLLRAITGQPESKPEWDFTLPRSAHEEAKGALAGWDGVAGFLAFSLGAKLPDKDWGEEKWKACLDALSECRPRLGIVCIGAADESAACDRVLTGWRGPKLNLCGQTAPLASAAIMGQAVIYLGHDSGPMHLAALVQTPCWAIFSARAKPGVWFPHGDNHRIFYPWELARTAPARTGFRTAGNSILSVKRDDVRAALLGWAETLSAG
jgi:heptosyltransferase-3